MNDKPMTEKETKSVQLRMHVLELAIRASTPGTYHSDIVQTAEAFHTFAKGSIDKGEVA
jgi:hypothetical protein